MPFRGAAAEPATAR